MNLAILAGAGLVAVSVFTSVLSYRVGAPMLLLFLGVGMLAGPHGLLGIAEGNQREAYFVGSVALAVILFDSGFETSLATVRTAAWPALVLSTLGVVVTTVLTGAAARNLLGLSWPEGLLLGAIVAPTDAAAVFFLLRVGGITLRDRVRSTLEVESGCNDPMAVFLAVTFAGLLSASAAGGAEAGAWPLAGAFLLQMGLGAVAGLVGGRLMVRVVNRVELDRGLYPVLVLALALCLFAATGKAGGSGFLAVYIAGVVAGNARLRGPLALRRFQSGMTWLCQIAMFLALGVLVAPGGLRTVALPAVALALFLVLVGRPLAVALCLAPLGFSLSEISFVGWVGLRGAVSILLGILPALEGVRVGQDGGVFFNVAFVVVVVSLLVQGWTIRPLARWLGLIVPRRVGPVERVELELPGNASHELVTYRIAEGSPVARGQSIPSWATPALVVRGGQSMTPHEAATPKAGDYVCIFAPPRQVRLLDRLFASPVAQDAQDHEFYGDFALDPRAGMEQLAALYGFEPRPGDAQRPVADVLAAAFDGRVEVGDRLFYDPVELIVRAVDDQGRIEEVGLALEPQRPAAGLGRWFQLWERLRSG